MAAVTICSDFGAPQYSLPLFPHPFAMKWWDQMSWSLLSVCWASSQLFSLSSFTSIKRLFSSSSLSAIRVVLSAWIAIPQSGLLSQVSSFRLPSGHSGQILTLSNAARASLPSPLLVADAESALLLCWELPWACNLWVFIIYLFFLPVMLPMRFQGLPQTHQWECFLVCGNFSLF